MILCKNTEELKTLVQQWKVEQEKVVFTNGVFDILHAGHVDYLQKAKALGDKLIVAINDDLSVRKLDKGTERPIHSEQARASVVVALRSVDAVIIFSEETPLEVINSILPDVLVKGGDYDPAEKNESVKTYIVGSKEVMINGGIVCTIPLLDGFSTTSIVNKLRQ